MISYQQMQGKETIKILKLNGSVCKMKVNDKMSMLIVRIADFFFRSRCIYILINWKVQIYFQGY